MDDTTEPGADGSDDQPLTCDDLTFELAEMCDERGWDFGVRIDTAAECAWSAEVRVTRAPNSPDGPDRSMVTFNAGGGDAVDALAPAVEDMLNWLNASRDPVEIAAAEDEFFHRLWYYRTLASASRTAGDLAVAEDKLREVEAKYPDLVTEDPFLLGMVHGKLSALRWVLGHDWDFLDT